MHCSASFGCTRGSSFFFWRWLYWTRLQIVTIEQFKGGIIMMKRMILAGMAVVFLLALTAPVLLAEESPPPTNPGGCSGPDCK